MEEDLALSSLLFMKICNLYRRWKRTQSRSSPKRLKGNQEQSASQQDGAYKSSTSFSGQEFWACPNPFHLVFLPMKAKDNEDFFENTCMNVTMFNKLVSMLEPETLQSTLLPKQIPAEVCLALTLEFLVKSFSYKHLASKYNFRRPGTVSDIISETCELLWKLLRPTYLAKPTESRYQTIAEQFLDKWHLPCCVGAITTKKIIGRYEKMFSNHIAVLATCDHNYLFTSLCIGNRGEFESTSFGHALVNNTLSLPENEDLTGSQPIFPYYFAASLSLPLLQNVMRPYHRLEKSDRRKVFNYRLSRGQQVIDNTFGILLARWQIFRKPIKAKPEDCKRIMRAAVVLHNFIMLNDENQMYCPPRFVDWEDDNHSIKAGSWRNEAGSKYSAIRPTKWTIRNQKRSTEHQRDFLAAYFESKGAVEFQNELVSSLNVEYESE